MVTTINANEETQNHLCEMESSQPRPRMMAQTAKEVNPLWAYPQASAADEIMMLDKSAINVKIASLGDDSKTDPQPDRTEWKYPTR